MSAEINAIVPVQQA